MRKLSTRLLRGAGRLYGAKLLFQWRVVENGKAKRRRLCEERVILIRAGSSLDALAQAKRYGKSESFKDPVPRRGGREVYFEFVGVIDLDDMLTDFTEHPTEVWYELHERLQPMERKRDLLVPEKRMRAVFTPSRRHGRVVL
jgi:uncharacterized protein DUF4288